MGPMRFRCAKSLIRSAGKWVYNTQLAPLVTGRHWLVRTIIINMSEAEQEVEHNPRKIFVGNLPFTVKNDDLSRMFSPYGNVIGVNIREDRQTGKPKGFAFVTFESEESATSAVATMNGYHFEGRQLTIKRANIRGQETRKEEEDNSWKSVPTPSPLERKKAEKTGKDGKGKPSGKPANNRPSWDTWVGPVATKGSSSSNSKTAGAK